MTAVNTTAVETTLRDFAAALDTCHAKAASGGLVVSRCGWVVASSARVADGVPVAGSSAALAAVRDITPSASRVQEAFADGLIRLHRQTLRDVLDGAVVRLDQRLSEGTNLLNRQLVQGSLADVALVLSEADDLFELPASTPPRRWWIHNDLVSAGRTVLKLYGASSFVVDGPGQLLYLAELLGNTYLHPGQWAVGAGDE